MDIETTREESTRTRTPRTDEIAHLEGAEFNLTVIKGSAQLPAELLELRKHVYVDEWGILDNAHLVGPNDQRGLHVLLTERATGKLAGITHMMEAELSDFVDQSGLTADLLQDTVLSSRSAVAKDFRSLGVFQLLIYSACHFYRLEGRKFVVSYLEDGDHPTHKRFKMDVLPNAFIRLVATEHGKNFTLRPYASTIDYIMYRGEIGVSQKFLDLKAQLIVREASAALKLEASAINQSKLWQKARDRTLTRKQYCDFLTELHQFVRYTTRIIALAVSTSEDKTLRRHFLKHLREETDHEVILEADLKFLGADVDYLLNHKSPSTYIMNFNGLQESQLSYRKDPLLYMAVPFAVEGISAFITEENIQALSGAIASWGVKTPERAMAFLTSHREFDGKEGGHWDMTLDMMKLFLRTEKELGRFLAIGRSVVKNMTSMIDDAVSTTDYATWFPPLGRRGATSAKEPLAPL